jgi:4-amino-4-deoxy-L-arabinose transferase-like glycosyltransferase
MNEPLISEAVDRKEGKRGFEIAGMSFWAIAFLVFTAAMALVASHYRPFEGDDLLELWCDKVPSLGQLLRIQRTAPLVIDPFFYHGITFVLIRLFGLRPFFLRLPSLCGFLVMQACMYYFVRRVASERAAIFALAIPAFTSGFIYTMQMRPYGVLLGLFGLAMISWQTAARREEARTTALVVLALSIAAAVNSQYYGVLLMLPLGVGEAVRSWERRRLDRSMLLAMGTGLAGMVFVLPFLKGAAEFRGHYKAGNVPYQSITQTYNFLTLGQDTFSEQTNHLLAMVLGLSVALVLWSCIRLWRGKAIHLPDAEFVFLLVLAALPVFAFLLGHFVTHAMESRYAIGAVIGMAGLLAIALEPVLKSRIVGWVMMIVLSAGFAWKGVLVAKAERVGQSNAMANLIISPEVWAAVAANPTHMIYTQDIDLVGFEAFNEKDPEVLRHLALVYSEDGEMRWNHSETDSKIIQDLKTFAPYTILPYESVLDAPGQHMFVVAHGGWNWLDKAFASGELQITPVGRAFGCDVVYVQVPQTGDGH